MPIKHLAASYRIRNGVNYVCWDDVNHDEAAAVVASLRAEGRKAFAEHNRAEGYSRVFVEGRISASCLKQNHHYCLAGGAENAGHPGRCSCRCHDGA